MNFTISVKPNKLNLPLPTLAVGNLSSLVMIVKDVPSDIDTLRVEVERTPESGTARANLSVNGTLQEDGSWQVYFSPFYFPDVSSELHYHVIGDDSNDNPRWLGAGQLIVKTAPTNGSAVIPTVTPKDSYVYNPTTGLYHKIRAQLDELGELSITIDETGVSR